MLASLDVEQRPGRFVFVTGEWPTLRAVAAAVVVEAEGVTVVVTADQADGAGAPYESQFAWLTLSVWSSLDAVGLTAAVSRALADAGIACNMIAGYHHDHILVPVDRVDDAARVLRSLSSGA